MLTLSRDLIFFDLETTGVDVDKDRIVQIAVMKFDAGKWSRRTPNEKHTFTLLLNPEKKIPKEASEVHHITNKMVSGKKTFSQIATKLYKVFEGCDVATYNGKSFDVPLLQAEFRRCGIDWKPKAHIDAYRIFKQYIPHSLAGALRAYCGEEIENAHDAMGDVKSTVKVLWAQLARHENLHNQSTDSLCQLLADPTEVDSAGKLKRDPEKGVVLNFSKYKGTAITDVPKSFFDWCKKENVFTEETWEHIRKEL